MGALERSHAAMAVRRGRADYSRARPAEDRVPLEAPRGRVQRPEGRDRLVLGAVRGPGGHVPGEESPLAKLRDVARQRSGERPPGGLDVAEADPWPLAVRRPRARRQVAVE